MKYIYARTSTTDQNVDQQAAYLQRTHADAKIIKEQASGKSLDRPEFNKLKSNLKSGDSVVVLSVSRLGRNTVEVLEFIEYMKKREVNVYVDDLGGLDVTSSTGKLVLTTLAAVAEMQRDEILDKQRIGIERAKSEGKYRGRVASPETSRKCEEALSYVEAGLSKEKAAKAVGIGVATLYRHLKNK
ncbi:recombinase family protein [Vibrio parahaemolyticus]|uniref:recombinase family protein n=1 Tax=Vibrio parahaemolyticus TaxID=670 RepID=UPI001299B710|nr:recombinase family protein [Vibrio parahaemolyticus]EJB8582823.1 recombinase family protein [Vibrio parahaemolyticus]MRE02391.1 recombinase family protein [Vibrio parahaemolyticus]